MKKFAALVIVLLVAAASIFADSKNLTVTYTEQESMTVGFGLASSIPGTYADLTEGMKKNGATLEYGKDFIDGTNHLFGYVYSNVNCDITIQFTGMQYGTSDTYKGYEVYVAGDNKVEVPASAAGITVSSSTTKSGVDQIISALGFTYTSTNNGFGTYELNNFKFGSDWAAGEYTTTLTISVDSCN